MPLNDTKPAERPIPRKMNLTVFRHHDMTLTPFGNALIFIPDVKSMTQGFESMPYRAGQTR
jgi:hypothetical protein